MGFMKKIKILLKILLLILLLEFMILGVDHILFINSERSDRTLKKEQPNLIQERELPKLTNLVIPPNINKNAMIALKHFPELYDENIKFIVKPASFPLASRPAVLPLLFPWLQRKYLIIISNEAPLALKPIMYQNLPTEAQIGVLGHELAHTFYYFKRSNLEIIYTGMMYLNKEFRKKFERATDVETIERGLGKELYQWSLFLQEVKAQYPEISKTKFIFEDRYLSPEEIKHLNDRKEKN